MNSRPRRPSSRPARRPLALLLLAVTIGVTGCATTSAGASDDCTHPDAALVDLQLVDDVRLATGGSTACLSSQSVTATEDTTPAVLPVMVTDAEGHEVEITDISRILPVDISGTIAATVFGLGLGENVVGRDSSTDFAGTENLPVVTKTGHTLNAEAILELAPTVMLTDTSIGPKEVRQQLRDAGIAVVVVSSERRVDTVDDLVTDIAAALGVPSRGTSLSDRLDAEVQDARAEVAEIVPAAAEDRARILFLYVRGNANVYYIFGRDSGADSLIEAIGGVDVASEIDWVGMKPMTAEALVAAQPDILIMMTDGLASVGGIDGLIERIPALAQTPAGEHRRVVDMADTDVLSFGPRTAAIIRALARAVYAPADSPSPTHTPSAGASPDSTSDATPSATPGETS